jgi:hypothetical protein
MGSQNPNWNDREAIVTQTEPSNYPSILEWERSTGYSPRALSPRLSESFRHPPQASAILLLTAKISTQGKVQGEVDRRVDS